MSSHYHLTTSILMLCSLLVHYSVSYTCMEDIPQVHFCNRIDPHSFTTCDGRLVTLPYEPAIFRDDSICETTTSTTPYAAQVKPLLFTTHPYGQFIEKGDSINLTCSISPTPLPYAFNNLRPSIYWTINGSRINQSLTNGLYVISNTSNSSTLHVRDFNLDKKGYYACVIDDNNYSLQSIPAVISLKEFIGWADSVYGSLVPSTYNHVILTIPQGGSAVLECNTKDGGGHLTPSWFPEPDNKNRKLLSNGNLFISNFQLSNQTETSVICILIYKDSRSQRVFTLRYNKNVINQPDFVVSPKSQIVSRGSNVTLYCITNSNITMKYYWEKNEVYSASYGDIPEVLELKNVSKNASYKCIIFYNGGSKETKVANIVVVEKPLVKIYSTISPPDLNVSIIPQNMSHDLILPVDNIISHMNITFQCLPNKEGLNYTWFFRGTPISSQESQFLLSGPNLTIFVTKLDNVLGTVQCFVENLAGKGTFSVRILKDVPNPPGTINITKVEPTNSYDYRYKLEWTPPMTPSLRYQLQLYSCHLLYNISLTDNCVIYDAKCDRYGLAYKFHLTRKFAVAAVSRSGLSSYSFYNNSCINIKLGLLSPLILNEASNISHEKNRFIVTLSLKRLSEMYPEFNDPLIANHFVSRYYYKDCLTSSYKQFNVKYAQTETRMVMSCNTKCIWRIGICNAEHFTDCNNNKGCACTKEHNFTTGVLPPSKTGDLTSVQWNGFSGQDIGITLTLPSENITCGDILTITVFSSPNIFNATFIVNTSTFNNHLDISIPNQQNCWKSTNVSFIYSNSVGNSSSSNALILPEPTNDCIKGFSQMNYNTKTSNLSWEFDEGMDCLINIRHYIKEINISLAPIESNKNCSDEQFWSYNFSLQNLQQTYFILEIKNTLDNYCANVAFTFSTKTSTKITRHYYTVTMIPDNTDRTTQSSKPTPDHSATVPLNNENSSISTSFFLKLAIPIFVGSMLILVGLCILIICCYMCIQKRKDRANEWRIMRTPDGSDVTDDCNVRPLLLEVDSKSEAASEKTDYLNTCDPEIMSNFLRSVPEDDELLIEPVIVERIPQEFEPTDKGHKVSTGRPRSLSNLRPPQSSENNIPITTKNMPKLLTSLSTNPLKNNVEVPQTTALSEGYIDKEGIMAASALQTLGTSHKNSTEGLELCTFTSNQKKMSTTPTTPRAADSILTPSLATTPLTPVSTFQPSHLPSFQMTVPIKTLDDDSFWKTSNMSTSQHRSDNTGINFHVNHTTNKTTNMGSPSVNHTSMVSNQSLLPSRNNSRTRLEPSDSYVPWLERRHHKSRSSRPSSRSSNSSGMTLSPSNSIDSVFKSSLSSTSRCSTPQNSEATTPNLPESRRCSDATSGFVSGPTTPLSLSSNDHHTPTIKQTFSFPSEPAPTAATNNEYIQHKYSGKNKRHSQSSQKLSNITEQCLSTNNTSRYPIPTPPSAITLSFQGSSGRNTTLSNCLPGPDSVPGLSLETKPLIQSGPTDGYIREIEGDVSYKQQSCLTQPKQNLRTLSLMHLSPTINYNPLTSQQQISLTPPRQVQSVSAPVSLSENMTSTSYVSDPSLPTRQQQVPLNLSKPEKRTPFPAVSMSQTMTSSGYISDPSRPQQVPLTFSRRIPSPASVSQTMTSSFISGPQQVPMSSSKPNQRTLSPVSTSQNTSVRISNPSLSFRQKDVPLSLSRSETATSAPVSVSQTTTSSSYIYDTTSNQFSMTQSQPRTSISSQSSKHLYSNSSLPSMQPFNQFSSSLLRKEKINTETTLPTSSTTPKSTSLPNSMQPTITSFTLSRPEKKTPPIPTLSNLVSPLCSSVPKNGTGHTALQSSVILSQQRNPTYTGIPSLLYQHSEPIKNDAQSVPLQDSNPLTVEALQKLDPPNDNLCSRDSNCSNSFTEESYSLASTSSSIEDFMNSPELLDCYPPFPPLLSPSNTNDNGYL